MPRNESSMPYTDTWRQINSNLLCTGNGTRIQGWEDVRKDKDQQLCSVYQVRLLGGGEMVKQWPNLLEEGCNLGAESALGVGFYLISYRCLSWKEHKICYHVDGIIVLRWMCNFR